MRLYEIQSLQFHQVVGFDGLFRSLAEPLQIPKGQPCKQLEAATSMTRDVSRITWPGAKDRGFGDDFLRSKAVFELPS